MKDPDTREGQARKEVGKAKETIGELTGDTETQAEGMAERAKGNLQEGLGKAKEAVRGAAKGMSKDTL